MSNVKTVPALVMVVSNEHRVQDEIARLWTEIDWVQAYLIDPVLVAHIPSHLQGMDSEALRAHRVETGRSLDELHHRPFDEVLSRTFSVKRVGEELSPTEKVVGFSSDGKFVFQAGSPRPSGEELSELSLQALRVLLAA